MKTKRPKVVRTARFLLMLLGFQTLFALFSGIAIRYFPWEFKTISGLLITSTIITILTLHVGLGKIKRNKR